MTAINRPSLKHPAILLATWFGLGLIPKAPGTWGSLGAIPFILVIGHFFGAIGVTIFALIITTIGFWATNHFEEKSKTHDNKRIVIDEVAGQAIALIPMLALAQISPFLTLAGFALFRLFDITKPSLIGTIDKKMNGAAGVMLDDVLAGFFAAICLTGLIYAGLS